MHVSEFSLLGLFLTVARVVLLYCILKGLIVYTTILLKFIVWVIECVEHYVTYLNNSQYYSLCLSPPACCMIDLNLLFIIIILKWSLCFQRKLPLYWTTGNLAYLWIKQEKTPCPEVAHVHTGERNMTIRAAGNFLQIFELIYILKIPIKINYFNISTKTSVSTIWSILRLLCTSCPFQRSSPSAFFLLCLPLNSW